MKVCKASRVLSWEEKGGEATVRSGGGGWVWGGEQRVQLRVEESAGESFEKLSQEKNRILSHHNMGLGRAEEGPATAVHNVTGPLE